MDPTNKPANNQAVQLFVLFIRFQNQLHVKSYKDSIQSSKIFITEGKKYTIVMSFMDKRELYVNRLTEFRACILSKQAECSTGTSCPTDSAIAPVEIFRKDETGANQETTQTSHYV